MVWHHSAAFEGEDGQRVKDVVTLFPLKTCTRNAGDLEDVKGPGLGKPATQRRRVSRAPGLRKQGYRMQELRH